MSRSHDTTRRQFLKAAAATAPYFVASSALGRGLRFAPSERITVGFIGVGNMGGGHLGGFLGDQEVQVVAICDVDAKKRERARGRVVEHYGAESPGTFRGCEIYNEYERLLERDDIDAVLIAVPDHWHATIAIAACRAGKDVYCEKPLALTIREARQMVRAARRYNTVFQTGSQQRSASNFRYACELVRNGRIGKLQTVNVGIGGPSREAYHPAEPVREGLDWDRWLGPAPMQPYNAKRCSGSYSGGWRHIRDYSGGMTTDWGAHHYDIAQWGMGMDGDGPVEITPPNKMPAIGATPDPGKQVSLTFEYANGVTMTHGGANGILFTGTEGKVEVNRGTIKTWPDAIGQEPIYPDDIQLYKSPGHRQDWLTCIRSRRRPICDVAIGASSVTVCHLANIAFWTGRTIRWDSSKQEIIGDAAAANWLDRPKRAPWRLQA
ncbi:MAG: Gfo/Idh/MocA family oxidoreductase [Planctomycetes bacterium]|nr:Gfo/Idh/MocA family oxidoreductase [Planctomycetota bacterium]